MIEFDEKTTPEQRRGIAWIKSLDPKAELIPTYPELNRPEDKELLKGLAHTVHLESQLGHYSVTPYGDMVLAMRYEQIPKRFVYEDRNAS